MPIDYVFDASKFAPNQGAPTHPPGKFRAYVSNTEIKPTQANDGGFFAVEWTTEAGRITQRFNLWNSSQKAVEIAHGQLSALSHVTGIYQIDMRNDGAALRNAQAVIEVTPQAGTTYTQVARVLDMNGNEPGKQTAPAAPAAPQVAPAPPPSYAPPPAAAPAPFAAPPSGPAPPFGAPPTGAPGPFPPSGAPPFGAPPQAAPGPTFAPGPAPAPTAPANAPPWQQGQPLPSAPPWQTNR